MHVHLQICIHVCRMEKQTDNRRTYTRTSNIDIHYMQVDTHKDGLTDREAHRQTDREAHRQRDRETRGNAKRHCYRQTETQLTQIPTERHT